MASEQSSARQAVAHQVVGTAGTVCNGPGISWEPAMLCLRLAFAGSVGSSMQSDHVMNIAMAVNKGAPGSLI